MSTTEAQRIMRVTPAEGLVLAEKAKGGAPGDVREFVLYAAWKNILSDRFIPTKKKPAVFTTVCQDVVIEVVNG